MQAATGNSLTSGLTPEGKTRPDDFGKKAQRPILGVSSSGWAKLARNLKAEIDENLIGAYCGDVSLPFEPGEHRRATVKTFDDRGIESLKVVVVE